MNCFYRISAGTLLIVSTAIFISGCQTVHLGAEKGVQKPKISRVTDPIEFSYRFVEADSYGIDMHRVLKVSNLSGRRELLGSWCAKEDSSDNLSYHLFQLCKQQKGERVQAVGPRQWCFRPSDRTVLFEWSDIWGNDSRCLTGERRKISVNAPASADEVNNPYWEGYWKSFGVDRNYDLKSAKKEKQTLHTPKASQKTKTQKKLSQKEIEFRSLDTERKTVVLEGHKFQYGLLDNGTPVVVLFGEDTSWVCVNCFNSMDARLGFFPAFFPSRPDKMLRFVSYPHKKTDYVALMLMARKGETIPGYGDATSISLKYDFSCSPMRKRLDYIASLNDVPSSEPKRHEVSDDQKQWEDVPNTDALFISIERACSLK